MVRLGSTVRFRLEAPKIYKGVTMEKFFNTLKMKIEDETAAFAILGAMIVTFAITIGAFDYIRYTRLAETSADMSITQGAEDLSKSTTSQTGTSNVIANEILEDEVIDEDEAKKKNEEEYEKLKKENKISSAADKYYIKVNYGAQVVTVYTKDSNGKYTKPVKAMVCSTGRYTPTSGTYRTLGKDNWWPLMGDVYGQYSTWICGDILFHSVPYLESGNKSSLEWWAYDQLGQRVSMGCVRLTVADAKWIYYNCPVGTQVEFYSSSNPGPLGKPTTRKISDAPNYVKGWDPTDPDSKNPWPKYLKDLENKKNDDEKENTSDKNETNTTNEGNTTVNTNTVGNTNTTDTNTTNTVDEPAESTNTTNTQTNITDSTNTNTTDSTNNESNTSSNTNITNANITTSTTM